MGPRSLLLVASLASLASAAPVNVWLKNALSYQWEVSKDIPINEVPIPCAHNAYNNPKNLPPLLMKYQDLSIFSGNVILENQRETMTQLMNMGIRHMQVDAHYIPLYNKTLMCHGSNDTSEFCPLVEAGTGLSCVEAVGLDDLGVHSGCSRDAKTWEVSLKEIADWIAANPGEFMWIEVEDQVSAEPDHVKEQFSQPVLDLLGDYLLTNQELDELRQSTVPPLAWPTLSQMRSINKTVIISGISTASFSELAPVMINPDPNINYPQNNAKEFDPATCNGLEPDFTFFGESDLKVVVNLLGLNISVTGEADVGLLPPATIKQLLSCGFSGCVDLVNDEDLTAMVWTWKEGVAQVPCEQNTCPVIKDGSWQYEPCSNSNYHACQSDSDPMVWALGAQSPSGNPNCGFGFTWNYPKTPLQNKALLDHITNVMSTSTPVWINNPVEAYNPSHPLCTYVLPPNSSASALSPFSLSLALLASSAFSLLRLL